MRLYTDHDKACCAVLEARVADGSLPPGRVLCADVRDIRGRELVGVRQIDLFAGIGGSPLGFAWAGWPDEWSVVTGGFPCQDISSAGKGAGLDGERSGLFFEFVRIVAELPERPLFLFAENVGALSARGLDRVAGEMGALGYEVEALRLGAWAVGSPQERERWWAVCVRRDFDGAALVESGGSRHEHTRSGERGEPGGRGQVPGARGEGRELARDREGGWGAGQPAVHGRERDADGSDQASQLADAGAGGLGAERVGGAGAFADQPGPGISVGVASLARPQGHGRHAGESQVAEPRHAMPRRWPHALWTDAAGNVIPTPQHDWEPPRLCPGTAQINAAWRLALMGYPLHWLDVPEAAIDALTDKRYHKPGKRERWWNREGIKQTGNCQCPQNVAAIARGIIDAAGGGA